MTETDVLPSDIYEPEPPRSHRRLGVVLLALLATFVIVVGAGFFWFNGKANPSGPQGQAVTFVIPPGSSTAYIAAVLDQKKVITSARLFRYYLKFRGKGPFQAGEYTFHEHSSFGAATSVLSRGPTVVVQKLTIPEGYTLKQIAAKVGTLPNRSADKFLAVAASGQIRSNYEPAGSNNLEGLVFPDTYFVRPNDDEAAILQRMVSEFDSRAAAAGIDDAATKVGISPYQAIILASMIEREAKIDEDRGKVAQVIYNRLHKNMLLQIDATVVYALGGNKTRVLYSDLKVESPYNTYLHKGLPPGPISSPGSAALNAAMNPTPGTWLFYVVVDAQGHHAFANTDAEQQANIRLAQQRGVR
ncbi:MAG: endolytic transglycosylase MltG [Actinobacteria bacterium]|nr:endolytic transglycosylase MltG [Actinomycetota bacterium]